MSTKTASSASAEAGPSRRTPVRSLRQPALLNIATRNDAGGLEPPSHSDAVALKLAMERKVQWRRKGERWMDRLCEGTVGADEFKRGAKYIEHHQYLETLHERHLNSHCSYPLCPNPPRAPYTSKPRISISVSRRAIEQKEGNEEDGFCSRVCKVRSGCVQEQMKEGTGVRGRGWAVELLEEVRPDEGAAEERQGKGRKESTSKGAEVARKQDQAERSGTAPVGSIPVDPAPLDPSLTKAASTPIPTNDNVTSPSSTSPKAPIKRPPPKPAPPVPTYPPQPQSALDDLLAGLVIVERPTLPPTLTPISPPPAPIAPAATSARASSSLIATPLKLASTLITASRLTGPVPQLAEDSDAESELSEWEMEMDGFGGLGEDEQKLFDEMRAARDLVEGQEGT